MLPCSSRVKLNRVALKDVIVLKAAAPRRRRRVPTSLNTATADPQTREETRLVSEPVSVEDTASVSSSNEPVQTLLTEQTGPDKQTADEEPVENRIGNVTQEEKRSNNIVSCKGNNDSRELKLEGPLTRGKYHQRKPNTRRKFRLDCLRRLCSLRLRCTMCFCTDSHGVQALLKRAEVKPRAAMSQIKSSNDLLVFEIPKSQKPLDLKSNVGKASGRGKFKQRKSSTRVAKSSGRRGSVRAGQSPVKATSAGCDPQPAAAHAGQMPTGQPTTLPNVDRNTHPSSTGLAGSEGSLRRAFKVVGCGDRKFVAVQRKRLGKQEQKSRCPVPEQPMIDVNLKEVKKVAESSQKIIIWIGKYPEVTLCDVAQISDALSPDCGFVLPHVLKTKVVQCFKDMRAGFQFAPGCFGHNKRENEEGVRARKEEFFARFQSEKSVCLSQCLAENQRHLKERTDAQALSSPTTCRFLKSRTSEGSATCSASFLPGKRAKRGECRTGMWDRDHGEDPGPRSHLMGAEIRTDKRIKLRESVQDGNFSSTPDLKSTNCKNPAKTDSRDKEKTCFWRSDESQSCSEHAQALSSPTTCRFLKSWTSAGSATCSASFLPGKHAKRGECRTGTWGRGDGEDPVPGSHLMGAEIRTDRRIKLGESVQDGNFSSTPDLKSINCKNPAKTDSRDKEKTCFWTSDESQSRSEHAVGGSSTFGSAVEENCVPERPCSEDESDAAQMSSDEVESNEPESFTCQRVRVYSIKDNLSCARTSMSWPFSDSGQTPETNAGTTAYAAEHVDPSDNSDSQINQELQGLPSSQTNETHPNEPRDSSSDTTFQASHQNEMLEKDGGNISTEKNRKRHSNMSSYCSYNTNIEFAPHLMEPDKSLAGLPSDTATLSRPSRRGKEPGTEAASASSLPVNGAQTDSSTSTPSPSALFLSDWETATSLSSMSSPFTQGGLSSPSATPSSLLPSLFLLSKVKSVGLSDSSLTKAVEKPLFYCEETRMTRSSSSSLSLHNSEIFNSCESSLLLPQDEQDSNEALFRERCPPKLEPYYKISPINYDLLEQESLSHSVLTGKSLDAEFTLPVMLSPVTSPRRHSLSSFLPQSQDCLDEEEMEEIKKSTCKMSPGCHMPQIVNTNNENGKDFHEHDIEDLEGVSANFKPCTPLSEPQSSPSTTGDNDCNGEESQDQTDCEDDLEQGYKQSDQLPSDAKIKTTFRSGSLTEPCSSPSSDEEDRVTFSDEEEPSSVHPSLEGSSLSKTRNERDENKTEAAGDTQQAILDEFTAYEHDILLVDVIQEDPELFENLPQESALKLGPARVTQPSRTKPIAVVKKLLPWTDGAKVEQRLTPVNIDFHSESPDITENNNRPWRPKCRNTPSKTQNGTWSEETGQPDANNNHESKGQERSHSIQTVNSLHNHILPLMSVKNGPWIANPVNVADFRRLKCNTYCRQYFSESLSCGFKMCRFQHVPVEGDEKFCIETVSRFIKNPLCLQKAGAVFTGYYHDNPPGVYFSMPVLLNLLWALLKTNMVSEVFSVLTVSLAHNIVPGHEFLLALFNFVREKRLMGFVPELIQLTSKMAKAGLVLSLDCLDGLKNTPEVQQTVSPNSLSGNHKLSSSAPFPEYLNMAHAIVEIELCTKQEDWRRMGEVFKSNCLSSQRPAHMEQISGRIAIALLSESKDKLSLPFGTFAETVCQNEGEDGLVRSFLGRIGVSLMLRYHKTHQWAKGRRVVEVLSTSKVNYTTLKGLFGNENGASRCYLVTVATELFLLSGSVEGALNTLRENQWFLSSSLWPCEPADVESRTRVLMRLAEKTSHRDALDILCNLPGIKEPKDLINISTYCPLFNSHLQVCLDRQKLPVATDTVDFMLCKNLAVDQAMLQILLHKLAKQNLWLRAREVFRHSLSVGYYPAVSAPPGFMALIVPSELGEVELALTLEMYITVNPTILHLSETTPCCLSITLKRTQSCESEYLSAGSRLLSAACIPQPKLLIHYKAVNSSQEQVFNLDISSARCWLRHNHLWANEVWAH